MHGRQQGKMLTADQTAPLGLLSGISVELCDDDDHDDDDDNDYAPGGL